MAWPHIGGSGEPEGSAGQENKHQLVLKASPSHLFCQVSPSSFALSALGTAGQQRC